MFLFDIIICINIATVKKKKKKKRERKKNRQGMLEMLSFGKYFAKPSNDNLALENRSGP